MNNNEHATVSSKDLVPTGNQTFSGTNGSNNVAFSGYQDAGITLEITPSISAQSYLRLELSLKVANFLAKTDTNPAFPPPKTEREVLTTVYLPNESTMVVGGIQVDNATDTKSSVPLLGDIPILGFLFSSHSNENNRRALYFFATPHILNDVEFADLQNLTYQRKLEARTYIGDDRMKIVDPAFKAIEPTADNLGNAVNSGLFEIPSIDRRRPVRSRPRKWECNPTIEADTNEHPRERKAKELASKVRRAGRTARRSNPHVQALSPPAPTAKPDESTNGSANGETTNGSAVAISTSRDRMAAFLKSEAGLDDGRILDIFRTADESGTPLDRVLFEKNYAPEETVLKAFANYLGMPFMRSLEPVNVPEGLRA